MSKIKSLENIFLFFYLPCLKKLRGNKLQQGKKLILFRIFTPERTEHLPYNSHSSSIYSIFYASLHIDDVIHVKF